MVLWDCAGNCLYRARCCCPERSVAHAGQSGIWDRCGNGGSLVDRYPQRMGFDDLHRPADSATLARMYRYSHFLGNLIVYVRTNVWNTTQQSRVLYSTMVSGIPGS